MELAKVLEADNLAEWADMGMNVFAVPVDGKFTPDSRARLLEGTEMQLKIRGEVIPEGFVELAEVDLLIEWSESFEERDNPIQELIDYVNSLAFPDD